MKYKVKAIKDANDRIGDVYLEAKTGEVLEVSRQTKNIALSTGKFVLVDETDSKIAETVKELLKLGKDELQAKAEELKLADYEGLNKEPLAQKVAEKLVKGEIQ